MYEKNESKNNCKGWAAGLVFLMTIRTVQISAVFASLV